MGSSSKAKTVKNRVASKPRAVLAGARAKRAGAAPSARGKTKTKTKAKAKAKVKGKTKAQAFTTVQENVAYPSYYPGGLLDFITNADLKFLEGSILKRLVRLEKKDKLSDLKKLGAELYEYIFEERPRNKAVEIMKEWAELCTNYENDQQRNLDAKSIKLNIEKWELWESTWINMYATQFVRILCSDSEDIYLKIEDLRSNLKREFELLPKE